MANPFSIEPANPLQALMTGVQGYDRAAKSAKEADILAGRQEAMTALQSGGDPRGALARLIGVGDVQGARAIATFADSEADRAFRQQESQRAQGNADRSFGLQQAQFGLAQQQARDAARGVEYREIDDGNGNKVLVSINKQTGQIERPSIDGAPPAQPNNPFATGGKQTDDQAKAGLYASRMLESEMILRDPKVEAVATSSIQQAGGAIGNKLPLGTGRAVMSEDFMRYDQAKRDFVNAVLRRESGAVISEGEFANAEKQYFPAPGDTPRVIEQKRKNRETAIRGIAAAAGRGFMPSHIFDDKGGLTPNPRQGAAPKTGDLPRVKTPAEAARLPKGTRFIDPNGVERVVP
jgi:hypothetical protein